MTRTEIQALIDAIADGVPNTALKVRTVLNAIADGTATNNQVIEIDVATSYIADNFDPTGLGINERLGWAICNGNNGTRDRSGRVPIQYSTTYPTLGATGGSEDAVVVSHSHGIKYASTGAGTAYPETPYIGDTVSGNMAGTETTGVSGVGKNMQPYIVSLFIMKLP